MKGTLTCAEDRIGHVRNRVQHSTTTLSLCYDSLQLFADLLTVFAALRQKYWSVLTTLDLGGIEKTNKQWHALVRLVWNGWNISSVLEILRVEVEF